MPIRRRHTTHEKRRGIANRRWRSFHTERQVQDSRQVRFARMLEISMFRGCRAAEMLDRENARSSFSGTRRLRPGFPPERQVSLREHTSHRLLRRETISSFIFSVVGLYTWLPPAVFHWHSRSDSGVQVMLGSRRFQPFVRRAIH